MLDAVRHRRKGGVGRRFGDPEDQAGIFLGEKPLRHDRVTVNSGRQCSQRRIFQLTGSKAERVAVKTGIETDKYTEIIGPIDTKRPIVTVGNYELQDGMAVRQDGAK